MSANCKDCGIEFSAWEGKMVMLKDHLWSTVCDNHEDIICNNCIEVRLKRKIIINDLKLTDDNKHILCNILFMDSNKINFL